MEKALDGIDITELLPQREPMLMVDRLTAWSERSAETEFLVRQDNVLAGDAELLLENVAQTCAARIGYYNKYILKKPVTLGYIGEIRNFEIYGFPREGDILKTAIDVEQEIFGISLVSAKVCAGGKTLAEGRMKIALKES